MPYLILFNNTGSQAFSVILNVVLPLLVYAGNITALATCARWMRAFARDRGLPFSKWIGHMNAKWQIQFKAAYAAPAGCVVLALIHLGSALTLNIIVSLSMVGLMSTYMLSIGCVFLKRVRGEKVPARCGEVDAAVASGSKASHYHTRLSCSSSTTFQLTSISASSAKWGALVRVLVIIIAVVW